MIPIRSSYRQTPSMPVHAQDETYAVVPDPVYGHPVAFALPNPSISRTRFVDAAPVPSSTPPVRRTRASKPKVKTGCITCKIRHVKCDEAKPACKRCTSTGRKCDGYEYSGQDDSNNSRPPAAPVGSIQLPTSMTLSFQGTVQERQSFQRFQQLTIPALSGGSEAEFWNNLVLKAGISELPIRTLIIALSTLHEDYQSRRGRYSPKLIEEPNYCRALKLYGKALRQLQDRLATTQQAESAKLAVISSILFTCFEILRRNDMTAIVHYKSGMRALMRHMQLRSHGPVGVVSNGPNSDASEHTLMRTIPQDELDLLLRVFARYDVQACTFAKPLAEQLATELPISPPEHLTLNDVRFHLDNLLIAAYQLIKSDGVIYRYWPKAQVPKGWRTHVTQQLRVFQQWHEALETFFNNSSVQLSPKDAKSLLGLRLQIRVAIIMLKTSIDSGPESTFDQFKPEFEEMITAVERVTQSLALTDADPLDSETAPFTMELGIVHPLFFIATKCRDQRLRKRAIAQLRKAGKEGVWEGPIMAVVAKRMMQIEQRGLISGQRVPESARIHKIEKLVNYDNRVVMAEMTLATDTSWDRWESIREAIQF